MLAYPVSVSSNRSNTIILTLSTEFSCFYFLVMKVRGSYYFIGNDSVATFRNVTLSVIPQQQAVKASHVTCSIQYLVS